MAKDTTPVQTVAVRKELFDRMRAAGQLEDRPGVYMVNKACEEYLERLEKQPDPVAAE